MLPGMEKALALIGCLALAGCANWSWEGAMAGAAAGWAGASASYVQPVFYTPPQPQRMVTCHRFGNTVQCF